MKTLVAPVDAWVMESKRRLFAVRNMSIEKVINTAQKPVTKGGRMRVDTGFLRASGQLSLTGMPTGPVRGADDAKKFQYDDGAAVTPVALILATASLGTNIFWGWSANYARAREAKDGFLRLAIQRWPDFVKQSIAAAKKRSKKK